ncbi:MAG TPA: hypothetical protein VN955_01360 [Gemmatimonadales bacterium]|nr:hypothetical protein [Gemmatimonadales bacterium]
MDEGTSARAARTLIAGGYDSRLVTVLLGGLRAWHQAGYRLDKWSDPRSSATSP